MQLDTRVVEPEDARKDVGGKSGGDRPAVGLAKLGSQLLAVGECDRRLKGRVQQEIVLGEKASEQQSVPLFIGTFRHQKFPVLIELPPLRAQPVAKHGLIGVEMPGLVSQEHAEPIEGSTRCALSGTPRS